MPTLYLIDGYAQFFRAYHAIRTPMTSPVTKEPTNMSYGFLGMMLKLLKGTPATGGKPDYIAVTLDVSGDKGTFRSQIYPQYKATRSAPPEDLFPQVERCLATLKNIGVPILGAQGFEADDVLATLVTRLRQEHPNLNIRIVSKDKDLKQLLASATDVSGAVELFDVHTDELFTEARLKEETGLTPPQIIDMLSLMGDSSDNVPGVEGIGPKTAAELICTYGSADAVLAAAGSIKGKRGEKLREAGPILALSRSLVTLRHDVPIALELDAARISNFNLAELIPTLKELGFNRYQDEVKVMLGLAEPPIVPAVKSKPEAAQTGGAAGTSATPRPTRQTKQQAIDAGPNLFSGSLFDSPTAAPQSNAVPATDAPDLEARFAAGDSAAAAGTVSFGLAPAGTDTFIPFHVPGVRWPEAHHYHCVRTIRDLDALIAELSAAGIFAFDTETTGLKPLRTHLCGLSFCTRPGTAYYVPVRSPSPSQHLDPATVLAALSPIMTNPAKSKCGHNVKFDLLVLRHAGLVVGGASYQAGPWQGSHAIAPHAHAGDEPLPFDSMIASYLIDASRSSHSMDALAMALLGHTNISIKELIGSGKQQSTFDTVNLELATEYAAEDADVTLRLRNLMQPQLVAMGLMPLFNQVEMPLVGVLAELEFNGITVDAAELDRQRERLQGRTVELHHQIDDAAMASLGRTFNPESPKQLSVALFNKPSDSEPGLGIKPVKKTKTGYSTDVEVLEQLAEDPAVSTPIPRLIVEHRQLSKLVGTYLVALKDEINPDTGRIHASFNQTVAATGRLSSSDPNLQNIPIRTDMGRDIRKAFVAAPGCVLVSADYSQIELRLLAHLSQDAALIEAFRLDQDIHTAVAAQINGVPLTEVTREMRSGAKMVNFGIVYGITAFGLARRLGIGNGEADVIITGYKKRFPGITSFLGQCVSQALANGYVETMLGRRRPIPDIESTNPSRRALAERMAINSVVQGSAADLIKLAMVDLQDQINRGAALMGLKMLLQIHDELVFECPEPQAPAAMKLITGRMEQAMSLSVPLKADAGMGHNWYEE